MFTKVYMIRRKADGFFSSGGMQPKFSSVGKIWRNLNTLHNHLSLFRRTWKPSGYDENGKFQFGERIPNGCYIMDFYKDCEIVECSISIEKSTDVFEYEQTRFPGAEGLNGTK